MIERADLDQKYIGTCFDRQVRIDLWNQDKLRQQTVLILGVGGLGSVVLISVLRLGVKKVIIVDYDVVDIHNLNRQVMYGLEDVGKSKVESALKNSKHHNISNTQIEAINLDAVKNWTKVIQLAKQSNIVFNCIDYGDKYDIAVASLCIALKIPLIMGGTFATMFTIDYVNPDGKACFLCLGDEAKINPELIQKISPEKILNYESVQFLPKNNNPIGRSSMMVCLTCAQLMVSHYVNYLFLSEDRPYKTTRLIGYHNTFEIIKFDGQVDKKCPYCGDPNYVQPQPPKAQAQKPNQQVKGKQQQKPKEQQKPQGQQQKKQEQNPQSQQKPIQQEQNKQSQPLKQQENKESVQNAPFETVQKQEQVISTQTKQ